jgi:hypothetical protein
VSGDHIAFSIWSLWSVVALFMPASVYGVSARDKLLLGAVATQAGRCRPAGYGNRIRARLGVINALPEQSVSNCWVTRRKSARHTQVI